MDGEFLRSCHASVLVECWVVGTCGCVAVGFRVGFCCWEPGVAFIEVLLLGGWLDCEEDAVVVILRVWGLRRSLDLVDVELVACGAGRVSGNVDCGSCATASSSLGICRRNIFCSASKTRLVKFCSWWTAHIASNAFSKLAYDRD